LEDHALMGGYGTAVLECFSERGISTPVVRIGWPDQFIEHGNVPALRQKHGITSDALVEKVLPLLQTRREQSRSSAA
jgi:1-deoxy-D-xylulose-5-phosphate synthase